MKKKYGSVIFQADDTGLSLTRIGGIHTFKAEQGTYLLPVKLEEIFNFIGYVKEKNQSYRFYVENLDNGIVSPRDQSLLCPRHTDHKECKCYLPSRRHWSVSEADQGTYLCQ